MAQFGNDTFSDETSNVNLTTHTADDGGTWTAVSGTINIAYTSGTAYQAGSGSSLYTHSGTPANANYTVSHDLKVLTTLAGAAGPAARVTDSSNYYFARYYGTGGLEWQLYKIVSGSATLLDNTAETLSTSTTYALVFTVDGTSLELTSDTVSKLSATDGSLSSAGSAGIRFFSTGTGLRIDNYSADDIAAGGGDSGVPFLKNKYRLLHNLVR